MGQITLKINRMAVLRIPVFSLLFFFSMLLVDKSNAKTIVKTLKMLEPELWKYLGKGSIGVNLNGLASYRVRFSRPFNEYAEHYYLNFLIYEDTQWE